MMHRKPAAGLLIGLIVIALLPACASQSVSYLDPTLHAVRYQDLERPASPQTIHLVPEWQTQGTPVPSLSQTLRNQLEIPLLKSGLVTLAGAASADHPTLTVIVNNHGDTGEAVGQGILAGLTFGVAGSAVTDQYTMTARFNAKGKPPFAKAYKHALLSLTNRDAPQGMQLAPRGMAVDAVLEQMILSLLRDLQAKGLL